MQIVMRDGRTFVGTALQITRQMKSLAFGAPDRLVDYLEWVAANARTADGVDLIVRGETDEELAKNFVAEMLRCKLAGAETGEIEPLP